MERVATLHLYDTDMFLKMAREVHGDKYDYSKTIYTKSKDKIVVVCPEHGEFEQAAGSHLQGIGCCYCAGRYLNGTETFVEKAREVHGDKYDYSKTSYVSSSQKVTIICPEHGEFEQQASCHLAGQGCSGCKGGVASSTEDFVKKARQIHGGKYHYESVDYHNSITGVRITCPKHGEFVQTPSIHLGGSGCPKCSESRGERRIREQLELHDVPYKPQWQFKKSSISKSRFDFAVRNGVVEYHGKQHYFPCSFGSKKEHAGVRFLLDNIRRDLKKERWCKKHGVPLLVIPYWDFDRIPEILAGFLGGEEPVLSDPPELVVKYEPMRKKIVEWLANQKKSGDLPRKNCAAV